MIKVAICDDHTMVLRGIETMLEDSDIITICATYNFGKQLIAEIDKNLPNVLLLDINLPDGNGIELCKELTKKHPELAIIGLSNYSETGFIKNMLRNGAKGYLLKNTDKQELILAITTVHKGETYLPRNIQDILLNESIGNPSQITFIPKLTRRETEVLHLVAKEHTNLEIADLLFISTKTVESHRNNLIQKLGVRNTAGLIRVALEKGLLG
ncbi:response regulator transcription factor [Maribacter polysiphoniae]|uniref:LuxR family two component transcriptional regulator n=1 Tax=Maribacter polysiphoniae TaxID=429344 RepID=A0A316EPI0_9FLAO|nr:response regulator transcription factor [Maribacter polysiphoniae]MBD1259358.1 response regulator transcription factor [Maribacter polysiphoniae]PWK24920.1 LuxR family two component transcriptional regulator [Maribacter polysiphoniae]